MVPLGHTGRRVVLGHTLNTQTLMKTKQNKISHLSKFMILCWATFIVILGCMRPVGHGWDIPGRNVGSREGYDEKYFSMFEC